jgi:hypothetical protein
MEVPVCVSFRSIFKPAGLKMIITTAARTVAFTSFELLIAGIVGSYPAVGTVEYSHFISLHIFTHSRILDYLMTLSNFLDNIPSKGAGVA